MLKIKQEETKMSHSPKELVKATAKSVGLLYDYIANHYWEMSKEELKEVLLAVLGVSLDNCHSEKDEEILGDLIVTELGNRYYGDEE